ncbi:protein kinase [Pendulispora brunnea]|uniref:Protein kinase n=1 Tax=Pendulispora brunnea TaxID=2905690 RepID=A0ABZ2KAM2_9BACT
MSPFFSFSASERALARLGAIVQQKYRIDRLIGVGGMGAVYAATHRNGHRVAIKFLHEGLWDDAESRRLFSREAYVANEVGHPGAVPVLDDDEDDDGCPFLIMPLLEGTTLRTRSERAPGRKLSVAEVAVVMADALDVLASAHAKGIVHRDIKPDNLFITYDGAVRVLDFGVARRIQPPTGESDAPLSSAGRMVGTPAFMPPEQVLGQSAAIGPPTDCWAIGATIFTLLSGELVHATDGSAAQLVAAATGPARLLAKLAPDLPGPLVAVVDKALSFDPADRWPAAREMREALLATFPEVFGKPPAAVSALIREQLAADLSPDSEDSHGRTTQPAARLPSPVVVSSETMASPSPKAPSSPLPPDARGTRTLREGETPPPSPPVESPRTGHIASVRRRRRRIVRAMLAGLALPGIVALVMVVAMVAGLYEPKMSHRLAARLPAAPSSSAQLTASQQEALVHLNAGIQDWRDASEQSAERSFSRAIELDSSLAAAHLYLAMTPVWTDAETREHHHAASAHRSGLSARDLALLEAYAPAMATTPDLEDSIRRLSAARTAFPSDWLVLHALADMQIKRGQLREAIDVLDDLLRREPSLAIAWAKKGFALALLDDMSQAREALGACLRASSYGSLCLEYLTRLDSHEGRCPDVEKNARTLMALPSPRPRAALRLASAIYGRGGSMGSVHDTLQRMTQLASEARRESTHQWNEVRFNVLAGDFRAAERALDAWGAVTSSAKYEDEHGYFTDMQLGMAMELGDKDLASRVAADFLAKRDAWLRSSYFDWEITALRAQYRAGGISREAFDRARQAWLAREIQRPLVASKNLGWIRAYAQAVATPQDAADALRALSDYMPMADALTRDVETDDAIGLVYLLTGNVEKALPYLRGAASSCQAVQFPFAHTRAHLHLGMALERIGDRAGACKAYNVVLARWGQEPRSTSAKASRSRFSALDCTGH